MIEILKLKNIHEIIRTVLNFLFIFFLQKYFTHIKSIKTLNKQFLLRCFLYAQKSIKRTKSITISSIVNDVIRVISQAQKAQKA